MTNLPYNLIKNYPTSDREIEIIKQRILHSDYEWWYQLTKYGLKYISAEEGYCFPSNVNIIGLGSFSVVYEIVNTNYVIKITNNETEINWSKTIESLQSVRKEYENNYVKIFDVISTDVESMEFDAYDSDIKTFPCSIIVLEKLNVLTKEELKLFNDFEDELHDKTGYSFFTEYLMIDEITEYIEDLEIIDKPLDKRIKLMFEAYKQLAEDVDKFGWFDYHFHNLMKTNNGNYKFIDLQARYGN